MSRNVQTIAFTSIVAASNVFELGFDPDSELLQGEPTPITGGSRLFVAPQPSPDGESLVAWTTIPDEGISIVSEDGRSLRELPVAAGGRYFGSRLCVAAGRSEGHERLSFFQYEGGVDVVPANYEPLSTSDAPSRLV